MKLPKAKSEIEELFALHVRATHLIDPVRELVFAPPRLWRVDFAWPSVAVAVEIEGAVHRIKGRFLGDLPKYRALTLAGWALLRYSGAEVRSGLAIAEVEAFLDARAAVLNTWSEAQQAAGRAVAYEELHGYDASNPHAHRPARRH